MTWLSLPLAERAAENLQEEWRKEQGLQDEFNEGPTDLTEDLEARAVLDAPVDLLLHRETNKADDIQYLVAHLDTITTSEEVQILEAPARKFLLKFKEMFNKSNVRRFFNPGQEKSSWRQFGEPEASDLGVCD